MTPTPADIAHRFQPITAPTPVVEGLDEHDSDDYQTVEAFQLPGRFGAHVDSVIVTTVARTVKFLTPMINAIYNAYMRQRFTSMKAAPSCSNSFSAQVSL